MKAIKNKGEIADKHCQFLQYKEESAMDYKRKIIEMVEKIEKPGTLEYLYTYIKLFLDRWG